MRRSPIGRRCGHRWTAARSQRHAPPRRRSAAPGRGCHNVRCLHDFYPSSPGGLRACPAPRRTIERWTTNHRCGATAFPPIPRTTQLALFASLQAPIAARRLARADVSAPDLDRAGPRSPAPAAADRPGCAPRRPRGRRRHGDRGRGRGPAAGLRHLDRPAEPGRGGRRVQGERAGPHGDPRRRADADGDRRECSAPPPSLAPPTSCRRRRRGSPTSSIHPITETAGAVAAARCGARHARARPRAAPGQAWTWFGARFPELCAEWDVADLAERIVTRHTSTTARRRCSLTPPSSSPTGCRSARPPATSSRASASPGPTTSSTHCPSTARST